MERKKKRRNWQFTLNQTKHYNKLSDYLKSKDSLSYLISCKEISPNTNHEHIHIFTHFEKPFKPSIKKCCGAHIEPCFGTTEQNINYIKKLKGKNDMIIEEYGNIPEDEEIKKKYSIKKVKEMNKIERDDLPLIYYNIIQKINSEENYEINPNDYYKKNINVFFIWGKSGIGKTKLAFKIISFLIENLNIKYKSFNNVKYENNFWLGVGDSLIALYDDFRDNHMRASEFINFIDYVTHILNVKYGSKQNNYEVIIITSIQNPEYLYLTDFDIEQKKQWLRRMTVVELKNENDINLVNFNLLLKNIK